MIEIRGFDFDDGNRKHLGPHDIDDNLVWEIFLGEPRFAVNPPRGEVRFTPDDRPLDNWEVLDDRSSRGR